MPYSQVTLAEIRTMLQDRWEHVPFWTTLEATQAINEALRWWNLYTGMWKKSVPILTQAATQIYALPGSLVYTLQVQWQSKPLALSCLTDLFNGRPTWYGEVMNTGSGIPETPNVFAPVGVNRVAIWPMDIGGSTLVVDGVMRTPVLVLDTDYIDLGSEELHALVGEALHLASFKHPQFQATLRYHQEFMAAAADKNARLKAGAVFKKALGLDLNKDMTPLKV